MSNWKTPVGPKDPKVYVRRRILVLLGLLAVVAVVVLVFLKPGSSGGARDANSVEVPSDIAAKPDSGDEKKDDAVAACAPDQLRVTPITDKSDYAEGELPQLSLSVENIGQAACSADLGTATLTFDITSGEDQVWRSTDCLKNPTNVAVILDPKKPETTEALPWDRTRSSPETCDITRDPVTAGGASYHLRASAAGVTSQDTAQFLLY